MSKIMEGLYIGNWRDAQNRAFLVNHKITHILCSASELRPVFKKNYEYMHVQANDTIYYNIFKHFDAAASFINNGIEKGGTVLVHCFAGISRSSSLTIAYLMKYRKMSLTAALKLCIEKRSIVRPNPSFMRQLMQYEEKLFQTESNPAEKTQDEHTDNFEMSPAKKNKLIELYSGWPTTEKKPNQITRSRFGVDKSSPSFSGSGSALRDSVGLRSLGKPTVELYEYSAIPKHKETRSASSMTRSVQEFASPVRKAKADAASSTRAKPPTLQSWKPGDGLPDPRRSSAAGRPLSKLPSARIVPARGMLRDQKERSESDIDKIRKPVNFSINGFQTQTRESGAQKYEPKIRFSGNFKPKTTDEYSKLGTQLSHIKKIKDSTYQSFFETKLKNSDWRTTQTLVKKFEHAGNSKPLADLRLKRSKLNLAISKI